MISDRATRDSWPRHLRHASAIASVAVMVTGALVLVGWLFDIVTLKRVHPWFVPMKANTAVLFTILGAGLWLSRHDQHARARRACGVMVATLGAVTLAEYLLHLNLGIDELLFREVPAPPYPGRMSPLTAVTFVVLGAAVLVPPRGRLIGVTQLSVLLAATGSLVALCGYLYGASSLYSIGLYSAVAFHTTIATLLACAAFLLARPQQGFMKVVSSETAAGQLLRRLLPVFVLAPIAIGWLRLQGELRGYYDTAFGLSLSVLSTVVLVTIFTWRFAVRLDRTDRGLRSSVEEIAKLNENLEGRIEVRTKELALAKDRLDGIIALAADAIICVDESQRITIFNKGAEEIFGWTADEVMGQSLDVLLPERLRGVHRTHVAAFAREAATARKMSERGRVFGLRKSGEEFPAEAAISKLELDAGRIFTVILRDISARVRSEEERQVFFALVENSSDFIGIADPAGKPIYVNPAGRRMVELAEDVPIEQTRIPEYYPPEQRSFATDVILRSMLDRGRWSGETYFRNWRTGEPIPVSDEHFMIRDRDGGRVLGMGTVTRDISAARRASDRLRESEERFRLTIDEAPIGMALVALDGRFVRVNRALCELVGYSADELTKLTFHDITHPDDLEKDVALAAKLARGEIPRYQLEKRYIRKDGTIVDVMLSGSVLRRDETPLYFIAQVEDITERKRADAALRISRESLSLSVEASGQGLWDWNVVTDEAHLSARYWAMIGRTPNQSHADFAFFKSLIHPEDLPAVEKTMGEHLEGRTAEAVIEYRVTREDGQEVWLRGIGRVMTRDETGKPLRMAGVITDITGERRLQNERAQVLREKETLLKEIHHRVKNNLQILSSLFYLQRQRTDQEVLRALLDESRSRIQSIALIHEKLYRSEQLARIDFHDYLKDLTRGLAAAVGAGAPGATVAVHAEGVFLDIERAIPCALIVNELVSNSFKHAFPGGRSGKVQVDAEWLGPSLLQLAVSDTGVGFPAALDFKHTRTLGMQLVCSLTTQLRGTVSLTREHGTRFEIQFPCQAGPVSQGAAAVPAHP